jgi:hypothetical protein
MKVLMLIISSDNKSVHSEHKKVWLSYMNSNPEIECYFIQYRDGSQAIEENIFWLTGKESFPGILIKTLDSFDYFMKRDSYDFIVRTNMSSVWNFNALLKYLKTLPSKKVYNGITTHFNDVTYCGGAGIIMTPDVVKLLLKNRHLAESVKHIDDLDIGFALNKLGIECVKGRREDVYYTEMYTDSTYDPSHYHYRVRWHNNNMRFEEPAIMRDLVRKIKLESQISKE